MENKQIIKKLSEDTIQIDNKVYFRRTVNGEDMTVLFCSTYKDENVKDDEEIQLELVGWVFGTKYEMNLEFIEDVKDCGTIAHLGEIWDIQ